METTWGAPLTWSPKLALMIIVTVLLAALNAGPAEASSPPAPPVPVASAVAGIPPTSCGPSSSLASGTIATIAGTGTTGSTGDGGAALDAAIDPGQGIAIGPDGAVYFGDAGGTVRRITTDGIIEVFASGVPNPWGLGFDAAGDLYVISATGPSAEAVAAPGRILRIAPDGTVTPVAGTGAAGSSGDGGPATEATLQAWTHAVAPAGRLYFDDGSRYRSVDTQGIIHAFAGTGTTGYTGDGGPATAAEFGSTAFGMTGPAVAPDGSVLLGDPGNLRIRRVDPSGDIDTYFTSAELRSSPYGLAVDPAGALYIGDWQAGRVFRVDPDGTMSTIAGTGAEAHAGDCVPATEASLYGPDALAVHDGVVYILEQGASRIRVIVP